MKKLSSFLCGLAVLGMMFTSCDDGQGGKTPIENIVEDGFYVVGEAAAFASLEAEGSAAAIMAAGTNENAANAAREGMYEKYIALEGGKPFQLVLKEGEFETVYGAELAEVALSGNDQPEITVQRGKMVEGTTMQVPADGLYHIVLDLNLDGSLEDKLILIAPVEWGVRGGMNGWGFTAFPEPAKYSNDGITWVLEDQSLAKGGTFKFGYNHAWKIQLDDAGNVKANTNLGMESLPNGANIKVEKAGLYTITLTYNLKGGDIAAGYTFTTECTKESTLPTELYMIGQDFGNWDWASEGVVELTPVHSHSGAFWTTRYITAANGFKFCPKKEWSGDFTGLGTDSGYEAKDGNCFVAVDGFYTIYIDLANNIVAIEPAAVYGMGDCFGGWDVAKAENMFVAEGTTLVSPAVAADGNIRMYVAAPAAITGVDWWQMEFNVFDGVIEYRGAGGDQAAVAATAGQKVTLDFNAGTGSIK